MESILKTKNCDSIEEYLMINSNLPGRAANLKLAYAFADYYEINPHDLDWFLSLDDSVETNTPLEFVSMCFIMAAGSVYYKVNQEDTERILSHLNKLCEGTWRQKEAVAMAFQRIGMKNPNVLIQTFEFYLEYGSFSQKRCIVATLADAQLMKNDNLVSISLDMSRDLLNQILHLDEDIYKEEDFKVLEKGLAYAISVFVSADPHKGFQLLNEYVKTDNKVVKRILKSNLSKARLKKYYPDEVNNILGQLS